MPIDSQELDRRLAEADRARLALRRATVELGAMGEEILKKWKQRKQDYDRSERSDSGVVGDVSSS